MDCPNDLDLHYYVNRELTDKKQDEIDDHIKNCNKCKTAIHDIQYQDD